MLQLAGGTCPAKALAEEALVAPDLVVTLCQECFRMKKPLSKKPETAASDSGKSFTVRLRAETAAEVQKIAEACLWSFSKTLGVLIEKAVAAKVLK